MCLLNVDWWWIVNSSSFKWCTSDARTKILLKCRVFTRIKGGREEQSFFPSFHSLLFIAAPSGRRRLTPVMAASRGHHVGVLRYLLEHGAHATGTPLAEKTALILAVGKRSDDPETLDPGVKDRQDDLDGGTVEKNEEILMEALHLLLQHGADVNAADADGNTALMIATTEQDTTSMTILLSEGADVNKENKKRMTPLMAATEAGDVDAVMLLQMHDQIDVNKSDSGRETALMKAVRGGFAKIMKLLLDEGSNVNAADLRGKTALHWAVERGDVLLVKNLLANPHIEVDQTDKNGRTALMDAAEKGHTSVVKLLLSSGANMHKMDDTDGWTAFLLATQSGHEEIMTLLLDNEADMKAALNDKKRVLNAALSDGRTALHITLSTEEPQTNFLLDRGALVNINEADKSGHTPLMYAAKGDQVNEVDKLLKRGADADIINNEGRNAFMLACKEKSWAVVHNMMERAPKPPSLLATVDLGGQNALFLAVLSLVEARPASASSTPRQTDLQKLLQSGWSEKKLPPIIHSVTKSSWTALMLAMHNPPIRDLLIKFGGFDVRSLTDKLAR